MANTDLLEQAKRDHQARTKRLYEAARAELQLEGSGADADPNQLLKAIRGTLHELALVWREEATAVMTANKKGCKGTAESLRDCATRLMAAAEGIKNHGLDREPETDSMPVATDEGIDAGRDPVTELVTDMQTGAQHERPAAQPITPEQFINGNGHFDASVPGAAWEGLPITLTDQLKASPSWADAVYAVGDKVTVAGIEFTKVSEDPFGTAREASAMTVPDGIFSGADPKTWAERKMPDVPVMQLDDPSLGWLEAPAHTSHSQAAMAASCGMEWWLKYRRGAPERPSWANIGGKAFHTFVESIEHGRFGPPDDLMNGQVATFTADYVRNQFELYLRGETDALQTNGNPYPMETWHASKQGKEGRDWWLAEGPEMVHRYLEWRKGWRAQGWDIGYVKVNGTEVKVVELPFESRGVKGYIDSAWIKPVPGGAFDIIILDWKAGSSMPSDYVQPTGYAIALMDMGALAQARHVLGAFWNARTGALGPVADLKVRHTIPEVLTRLEAPKRMDAAGLYMPNVNSGFGGCGSCSRKLSCPVGSQQGKGLVELEQLTSQ